MDSERDLRTEFRRALDNVLPPVPWLEAAVAEDLQKRRAPRSVNRSLGKSLQIRPTLPRPVLRLAAGVVIVVLAAAAVATFLGLRFLATQSTPAGALSITAYQTMVGHDVNQLSAARDENSCASLESACPAPGRPALTEYQQWLDDLNRSEPPARFAVIDAQIRRHLAAAISDLNAVFAAYRAQDLNGLNRGNHLLHDQAEWLETIANSIFRSNQGTVAAYIDSVRVGKLGLATCDSCQRLEGTGQGDCAGIQTMLCEADVTYAKYDVEGLEAALASVAAPNSLAAQDASLQRDLALADTGVLDMANAQLTGDQAGFGAGRLLFKQALPAINADIASVLGG